MIFISENVINATISDLEQVDGNLDERIEALKTTQPMILAYITSAQFDMLNESERDYLLYLTQVLVQSIDRSIEELPTLEEAIIGEIEEKVWTMMESAKGKTFRDRLDIFFENYPQEDLLAFVEDSLAEDEEDDLSPEGRELMFVALKTLIDGFEVSASNALSTKTQS